MILKEIEITEETKETLFEVINGYSDEVKWLAIDCYVAGVDLYKGIMQVHELLQLLETIDYLNSIKTVLVLNYPSDRSESKIKVKLFDEEPKITENILINS